MVFSLRIHSLVCSRTDPAKTVELEADVESLTGLCMTTQFQTDSTTVLVSYDFARSNLKFFVRFLSAESITSGRCRLLIFDPLSLTFLSMWTRVSCKIGQRDGRSQHGTFQSSGTPHFLTDSIASGCVNIKY